MVKIEDQRVDGFPCSMEGEVLVDVAVVPPLHPVEDGNSVDSETEEVEDDTWILGEEVDRSQASLPTRLDLRLCDDSKGWLLTCSPPWEGGLRSTCLRAAPTTAGLEASTTFCAQSQPLVWIVR